MLHAALPQVELITIPDADHSLHMTNPAALAAAIGEFLKRHPIEPSRAP